jgi:hydrogenase maturation protease
MSDSCRFSVLVVGIGNPDRGDDGFGPAVARRLRGRVPPGVGILERSGDAFALIEEWDGFAAVILVDAAAPISQPGRIHRLDLTDSQLSVGFARGSTHAFGIAETVELARSLGRLPSYVVAYLVEGEGFDNGAPLSPIVTRPDLSGVFGSRSRRTCMRRHWSAMSCTASKTWRARPARAG